MLDFLNFLRQKYSEKIGSRVRQGTTIDELAIKPTALVMTDFYNLLVEKQKIDNIDNYASMTEENMDYFGNRFFYPRVVGEKAFGNVRVWLNDSVDVFITETFRAISSNGLQYLPINTRKISKNSLKVSTDSYGKYYFDIGVIAENRGSQYNILENDIQSISGVDFSYSYATNLRDFVSGSIHENNEQYKDRLKYSLNDRSLANKRSLYANFRAMFPYVYSAYIAGAGDRYMTRDRVQAIDLSDPPKEAKFFGKITGDSIVKHSAYYGIYPGLPGTQPALYNGPFSIRTEYPYPQTVEAVDLNNSDPAYHGYPIYQEATDEMYRGLYYDDYRNFMDVSTTDLFNISDVNTSATPIVQPDDTWSIGYNGRPSGDYGDSTKDKPKIIYFQNQDIVFRGNINNVISVCKDVSKRAGFKVSGRFKTPTDAEAGDVLQMMFGGPRNYTSDGAELIDSFTGIGFGISIFDELGTTENNAVAFFAHSNSLNSTVVFSDNMQNTINEGFGTIKERQIRLALDKEYRFEYVVYDDLSMSLIIDPIDTSTKNGDDILSYPVSGDKGPLTIDSSVLKYYQSSIMDPNSLEYGTLMKITLDGKSDDESSEWIISRLKVVDTTPHRPTAMFMFNIDGLEEPMSLIFRGSGLGAVNKVNKSGHSVYVWNTEIPGKITGNSILSSGGWQKLDGVSDTEGIKDTVSAPLSQPLTNIDRYAVNTRYGKTIIFMAVCEGQSYASIQNQGGSSSGDLNATLLVDYIKLQDSQINTYRGNNKCDIYVSTLRNTDNFKAVTKAVTLTNGSIEVNEDNGFEMPIASIDAIMDTGTATPIASSEYSIIRTNTSNINSPKDSFQLSVPGYSTVTIEYSTYNNLVEVQDFFEGAEYGKPFGNVLIKHKYPTYLDIAINYSGSKTEDEISTIIRSYFDDSVNNVFDVNAMIAYLYSGQHVNYIYQPIIATYEALLDNGSTETGSITSTKTIRPIDFFRIRTLNVNQVTA